MTLRFSKNKFMMVLLTEIRKAKGEVKEGFRILFGHITF